VTSVVDRAWFDHRSSRNLEPSIHVLVLAMLALWGACLGAAAQLPSPKGAASFQQAETLRQQNRLTEAKSAALEGLAEDPANVDGYNLLGIIDNMQLDYADARKAFEKALQLAPRSAKSHNNLGSVHLFEHHPEEAEKEFRTALQLDPANQEAHYNLGLLLLDQGSAAEAIAHFERVHPQTMETRFGLARAYFMAKRRADALRIAAEISTLGKDSAQAHLSLGVLLASQKQYKPAELELEKADALQPGSFEIAYNLGQAFLIGHQYPSAELQLSRALKLKPESPQTMYLLAQVYREESRPLDALELLVRANKLEPEDTDIILLMAQVTISQKYFEDAIPLLEKGEQIAPQRMDLRATLGEAYFKSNQVDKAIDELAKVIAIEPTARSYAFLGLSYEFLGRFDEARRSFQNGLKLEPKNNFCLFHIGYIAERQGDVATAGAAFERVLRAEANFPEALLELANLRVKDKKFLDAEELLKRYIRVSAEPADGYYKLAMVERSLHQTAAAARDLDQFQTLSKTASSTPYVYEHLYDYLDNRSKLPEPARKQQELQNLIDQNQKHPRQPELLYLLAAAYFKAGETDEAKSTIAQLDSLTASDYRTMAGVGVLLARYRLLDEAIQHFQWALQANPDSDEIKFDLANAYFRKGLYNDARSAALQLSEQGVKDDASLALLGDIYAHLGEEARAEQIFRDAVERNPDNDQAYLSLALLQMRQNQLAEARETLLKGEGRVPASGKILWGLGLTAAFEGNTAEAGQEFERAVEMLPEWPGSYSTLGVFYFQTGQVDKAKEVLDRFSSSNAGGLDVARIERVLEQAPQVQPAPHEPMSYAGRRQLLQFALSLADKTL
jgi:tetratricopeptide (TPR) repeat protein